MDPKATLERFHFLGYRHNPEDSPLGKYFQEQKIPFEVVPLDESYGPSDYLGLKVAWKQLEITVRQPTDQDILICLIRRKDSRSGLGAGIKDLVNFIDTLLTADLPIRYYGGCVRKIAEVPERELAPERLAEFYQRIMGGVVTIESKGLVWMFADREAAPRFQNKIWRNRPGAAKWRGDQ